jgi:3-hydroxyisobutyrate dehydrogenase-like beta-hydroxyacid dehydrogenase
MGWPFRPCRSGGIHEEKCLSVAELGYVGLGVMGGGVARRLLRAGHSVSGWNRTKEKASSLIDAGLVWCETPREVAERCEVVFTMVANTAAVQAVTQGPDGVMAGLGPGKTFVDMSTASPETSRAMASHVTELGAQMLDAPVSGSVSTLEQGRLTVMVGGPADVFERILPILREIGPTVIHVGPNGAAVTMKIATNLSLAVQMLAFSEGVLLAEKSGIPRSKAVEVLLASVIASPMLKYRGPFVLDPPAEAWFDVNMMQKDMNLALELGRSTDVPLPTTAVANELLTAARGLGLAHRDFAALFDVLTTLAGVRSEEACERDSTPTSRLI